MADALDLKSPGSDTVPVRVRSPAPLFEYRGVEQLVARRAHNPEVAGSSPVSATIKVLKFCDFRTFSSLFIQKDWVKNLGQRRDPVADPYGFRNQIQYSNICRCPSHKHERYNSCILRDNRREIHLQTTTDYWKYLLLYKFQGRFAAGIEYPLELLNP